MSLELLFFSDCQRLSLVYKSVDALSCFWQYLMECDVGCCRYSHRHGNLTDVCSLVSEMSERAGFCFSHGKA